MSTARQARDLTPILNEDSQALKEHKGPLPELHPSLVDPAQPQLSLRNTTEEQFPYSMSNPAAAADTAVFWNQQQDRDEETKEAAMSQLCEHHIRTRCRYGQRCFNKHLTLPHHRHKCCAHYNHERCNRAAGTCRWEHHAACREETQKTLRQLGVSSEYFFRFQKQKRTKTPAATHKDDLGRRATQDRNQ